MPQVNNSLELSKCQFVPDEFGGYIDLAFRGVDIVATHNATLPAALAVKEELDREIAAALSVETPQTKELARRRADLAQAEERLSFLQSRPRAAYEDLERLLEAGDMAGADKAQAELATLPNTAALAEKRARILRRAVAESESAVDLERRAIEQRIRDAKRRSLEPGIHAAYNKLAAAVEKIYPMVVEARGMAEACNQFWRPVERGYPLTAEERAAIDAKNEELNRERAEAERKAREDAEREGMRQWRYEQAVAENPIEFGWARALGRLFGR